jgi:cell division transport system permease protein
MMSLLYYFQTAIKNIWTEKWINSLTILSISIGMLILCTFGMITFNLDSVLKTWSKGFGIVIYLDEKITKADESGLQAQLLKDKDFLEVKFVSKDQALSDVRQTLGDDAIILDEIKENPLPSSFELKLKSHLLTPSIVEKKAAEIKQMNGVMEVQYGNKWLSSLSRISETMQLGAVILGCAIFIAVTFISYSTIKIYFHRRKNEVETLKLLGASKSFIKFPFLIEGLFIGTLGGIISSLAIYGGYSFTTLRIVEFLPSIKLSMASLPVLAYLIIPVTGASMSLIGSYIAIGKIRY